MPSRFLYRSLPYFVLLLIVISSASMLRAQDAKRVTPETKVSESDADHVKERDTWFYRGRVVRGWPSAELRRRAYEAKLRLRAQRAAVLGAGASMNQAVSPSSGSWVPLGPVPLASDATGNGTQDYHQVAGRATAVAIDPADASGNTLYVGGAQAGVWKSTNAATSTANQVAWSPLTDGQATLSIGAIAIQPGNADPAQSLVLAATGEADNSGDSYFGLGILRSTDAGNTWSLIQTANSGALSFSGLGGTRMAFSSANPNTVVAAMATTSEGLNDGAITTNTTRGLYTSLDAGQTWSYNALVDPGGATDANSATAVVYDASAGLFLAAVRYHGFYSSPDGVTWTRLSNQPGGNALSPGVCPPQSSSNNYACPIYRAEITVVPGRNEMYVWYIYLSSSGEPVDGGIWQTLNGGASWTSISDSGIANCGDVDGCGVEQGAYNLELLAVPNCPGGQTTCAGNPTDLYAGAINIYKCSLPTSTTSPACSAGFLNLTHVYGCDPIAAPSHVHPDQHALAYIILNSSSTALMYFANDGGIYRALDGFSGLTSGSCTTANGFDDLNQNLGSMTQFVSFSQHPTDPNTMLGGTQDNGSPATSTATSSTGWGNVLGGDGGYNAIDPTATSNWYASNPDVPPGGLGVQMCSNGVNCNDSGFSFVVTSSTVGGDDGAFYFPYILDPRSSAAMLVGTCRVWRGPRTGGGFTVLSPNFDTLGSGTCTGSEVNQVQALAVGGSTDANGSAVVYATTSGLGPIDGPLSAPSGGHVWVTTDASSGISSFADVTANGPLGSIDPNQYPISGVATDSTDSTGNTAYVTVMGFTGGPGHVWKTTNAGATWSDFTGNLPDSPANAVVVYPPLGNVYVATDVGVFVSPTSSASWTEMGPSSSSGEAGFLPNVAVTALGVFASGGQQLLRVSTYGRGIWQFNLVTTPDFDIFLSNSPQTASVGQTATFNGTANALNGYASVVTLSCVAGATPAPSLCSPSPSSVTPGVNTAFSVSAGGSVGDYYFNVQGAGSDSNQTTHQVAAVLHVLGTGTDFSLGLPSAFPSVNAGSTTMGGSISVTTSNGFTGNIALACSLVSGIGSCSVSPGTVTTLPSTANVSVNATNLSAGNYQLVIKGTSGSLTHTLVVPFNVGDYQLTGQSLTVGVGSAGTANLSMVSTYYSGNVDASCDSSALPGATCTLSPASPIAVSAGATVPLTAVINVPASAALGNYTININTHDTSGIPSHSLGVSLAVTQNFTVTVSPEQQSVNPGQNGAYTLTLRPEGAAGASFNGAISLSCSSGLPCAFNPSTPVTPGSNSQTVALTISTNPATLAGGYAIGVTATSASPAISQSASLSLVVNDGFQLNVSQPFPAYVDAGSTETAVVSITPNYNAALTGTCTIPNSISGAQCTVTPAYPLSVSANQSGLITVALNVPAATAAGTYISLGVADSSGQPNYTLHLPIDVEDFSVASATSSQTVSPGQTTGAYSLTLQPVGASFDNAVTLSCSAGLPPGAVCSFNPPAPVTPGGTPQAVAMTISTTAATSAGVYPLTITGTSGPLAHAIPTPLSLVIASSTIAPDFKIAVTQGFASTASGGSVTAKVSVNPNYSGAINVVCDASAVPAAQCVLHPANPVAITANTVQTLTVTLALPNDASPGTYNIGLSVSDSSGQPSHSVQIPVTVIQDFSVTSSTASQTVNAGQTTGAYQLMVAPNPTGSSFPGTVTLACANGLPAGAQCLFSPSSPQIPGNSAVSVVMSISTASTTAKLRKGSGRWILYAMCLLPALVIGGTWRKRSAWRAMRSAIATMAGIVFLLFLVSCAGVSTGGNGSATGSSTTYQITVTGSSPGTPPEPGQSTVVTLVVN